MLLTRLSTPHNRKVQQVARIGRKKGVSWPIFFSGIEPAPVFLKNGGEMALLNLAVNARDAMPDGGQITIEAAGAQVRAGHPSGLSPGHYVCLSVTDNGGGMDAETLARATDPFFTTKALARAPDWGCRWFMVLHGMVAGVCASKASRVKVFGPRYGCPWRLRR